HSARSIPYICGRAPTGGAIQLCLNGGACPVTTARWRSRNAGEWVMGGFHVFTNVATVAIT
ncbi:MAG: hypothetical protein NZ739_11370, partial [Verrucomicrobiae bacterium]|nr:hypothetical protein [Verrucomicrobiae bacterium]